MKDGGWRWLLAGVIYCPACLGFYCERCELCQGVLFGRAPRRQVAPAQASLFETDKEECPSCGAAGFHMADCPELGPVPVGPTDPRD